MTAVTTSPWGRPLTAYDFSALDVPDDGRRYELLDGRYQPVREARLDVDVVPPTDPSPVLLDLRAERWSPAARELPPPGVAQLPCGPPCRDRCRLCS